MRPELTEEYLKSQGLSQTIERRFLSFVIKTDTCWIWKGTKVRGGYGQIGRGVSGFPRMILAHRASWVLYRGQIPDGLDVLHNCPNGDRADCVCPAHLWVGTHSQNMKDMVNKGRSPVFCGVRNHQSRLSIDEIMAIRGMYVFRKTPQCKIAELFGVSQRTINKIVRNISYFT